MKTFGGVWHAVMGAIACALPLLVAAPAPAAAEPLQIGGWFGPRIFSGDSQLGWIPGQPYPGLETSISLGPRIGLPFGQWLVAELELGFSPTQTEKLNVEDRTVRVYWLEPRLHARLELMPGRRLQPFVLAGGGAPFTLSTRTRTFDTAIIGSGYLGGGVRFDSQKGFRLRLDARVALLPGIERVVAAELDIGLGLEVALGKRGARPRTEAPVARGGRPGDRDDDDIPDAKDGCPDRAEDADGFDDQDGCPDIDNDLDRVLDIADRCATLPELYNGFEDDDGCPDVLPAEVDGLKGTIEGLLYAEGETGVREAAQKSIAKIAKIMTAHPSIRVVLIGHTDDREAKQFAATEAEPPEGQPAAPPAPPDLAALAVDMSRARAEGVRQAIAAQGIAPARIDTVGKGAEEPVADNAKPAGRRANRRVEIKLYVPPSGGK
jgi:outer membrane protein OmpA-like peptidoglycan-associated protein